MEKLAIINQGIQMKSILDFYKNKKVFITGHTGFKGAWLCQLLLNVGAVVKGYALRPNTEPALFSLLQLETVMESCIGDVNDYAHLEKEILVFEPDFIFHLAAQPLVRYSYKHSVETHQTNIIGTANVLEAARGLKGSCKIVCITTDKVYKNKEWQYPYRESDELGGYDPYSASKAAAELVIASYRESFFTNTPLEVASVRAGNVIGGGDWSQDRLIPDMVRSFKSGEKVILRNPDSIRPWQHVLDPLFGYLKLGMFMATYNHQYDQAWNFGPASNDTRSVAEVAKIFHEVYNVRFDYTVNKSDHLHEAGILKLDISKSSALLRWGPCFGTNDAIAITANWYKSLSDGITALELVNKDIQKFLSNTNGEKL